MSVNNIHNRLEQLIDSLSITEGRETYLRHQIVYLERILKEASKINYNPPENQIEILSNSLEIIRFWYGGSFDRGVHINEGFDLDIYLIYSLIKGHEKKHNLGVKSLSGEILFKILYDDLEAVHRNKNPNLIISNNVQFKHAVPIELEFNSQTIYVDCIPAIELPDGYLIAPNGWEGAKKVNLLLEEQGLSNVNKKTNGRATKLILLLKYWNWNWEYPLKSYVIQRLVEEIYVKNKINSLDKAVKNFFSESIHLLNKYYDNEIVLRDRVYSNKSILNDYQKDTIDNFYESLQEANQYAMKNEWKQLFGDF